MWMRPDSVGGGVSMEYTGLLLSGSNLKTFSSSQNFCTLGSISFGSYFFASSVMKQTPALLREISVINRLL